jgi:hypothetical protein
MLPVVAVTTGTSITVASTAVSGAASAVVDVEPHADSNNDELRMKANPR